VCVIVLGATGLFPCARLACLLGLATPVIPLSTSRHRSTSSNACSCLTPHHNRNAARVFPCSFLDQMQLSMSACGAPLRMLMSLACQLHGSTSAVGDAFTALAMGRAVWLGDTSDAFHKQRPTEVRLAAVPRRYQQVIVQHYGLVRTALRNQFGWRAVMLDAGNPLPPPRSDTGATDNRFATLDPSSPCDDRAAAQAELHIEDPAPALTGCVVKRRFGGKPWFGVATFMPEEEQPFVFRVRYTDGDSDTMRLCNVRRCAVTSWADVPRPLHTQLQALGARMPGPLVIDR
jgi:hypothetical protein